MPAADSDLGAHQASAAQTWVQRRGSSDPRGPLSIVRQPAEIPEEALQGEWTQPAPRRRLNLFFVGVGIVGGVAGIGLLLWFQTFDALAVLVGFTVTGLLSYTALTVAVATTVTLDGPILTVRCGEITDVFDLSGPLRRVTTIGRPNRPTWRVQLETTDGKVIELTAGQVDPELVQAAISRYRSRRIPQQRTGSES